MRTYRPENDKSDLEFSFPDDLNWEDLDKQNVKMPVKMKFVDLIIERESDLLLVEVKDPSHADSPLKEQQKYLKRLKDNSILTQELTPKARDSYTFMHLMNRDSKPIKYIVLLGMDAFEADTQKGVLFGFKDRLLTDIRCEASTPWKREHIKDCIVLSVEGWNQYFSQWPLRRISDSRHLAARDKSHPPLRNDNQIK